MHDQDQARGVAAAPAITDHAYSEGSLSLPRPRPCWHCGRPEGDHVAAGTVRAAEVAAALDELAEVERLLAHAKYALRDILDPKHPRHLSVIDARDVAYLRVKDAADAATVLCDRIGNLPGIDPDADR